MAGEWREATLDQLGRIVTGKTPPSSRPDYFGGHIPFVTPTDLDGRRIIETTHRYLTESGADLVRARIPAGAVMVSCIGSDMGKAAMAARECVTNQQINSIIVAGRDNPLFVYYNLSTRKAEIRGTASGSAQPILNKSAFGRLEILLPPPNEQHAITHILGTLDDKIELNRRMSETLEAMARALFKSWFVDFDPVRTKTEGRDPGLPQPIADLFPSRFVESELGEIPEGWHIKQLRELASYLSRGIGPHYVEDGGIWVLNQKCIRNRRVSYENAKRHDPSKRSIEGRTLRRLDILVNSTGVGTLGRVAQLLIVREPTIVDSHVSVVRAAPDVDPWFLGVAVTSREAEIEALGEGSTGQTELSRERLGSLLALTPPRELQSAFACFAGEFFSRLAVCEEESATLATLRDGLLPKLISGELRVRDAEKIVGRAA